MRFTPAASLLHLLLLLLLACGAPRALAATGNWFELQAPGPAPAVRVEVDAASLVDRGFGPELALRVTHAEPRMHAGGFMFGSFVAQVRFDCGAEALEPTAVSYFSGPHGKGAVAGVESDLRAAGIAPGLLAVVDPAVRRALLRGACGLPSQDGAEPDPPAGRTPR